MKMAVAERSSQQIVIIERKIHSRFATSMDRFRFLSVSSPSPNTPFQYAQVESVHDRVENLHSTEGHCKGMNREKRGERLEKKQREERKSGRTEREKTKLEKRKGERKQPTQIR